MVISTPRIPPMPSHDHVVQNEMWESLWRYCDDTLRKWRCCFSYLKFLSACFPSLFRWPASPGEFASFQAVEFFFVCVTGVSCLRCIWIGPSDVSSEWKNALIALYWQWKPDNGGVCVPQGLVLGPKLTTLHGLHWARRDWNLCNASKPEDSSSSQNVKFWTKVQSALLNKAHNLKLNRQLSLTRWRYSFDKIPSRTDKITIDSPQTTRWASSFHRVCDWSFRQMQAHIVQIRRAAFRMISHAVSL